MRHIEDKIRKSLGKSPLVTDAELEEIATIMLGEDDNPNDIEALRSAGITDDVIEDIIDANPEQAGI
jgi:hypothetical protein